MKVGLRRQVAKSRHSLDERMMKKTGASRGSLGRARRRERHGGLRRSIGLLTWWAYRGQKGMGLWFVVMQVERSLSRSNDSKMDVVRRSESQINRCSVLVALSEMVYRGVS